MSLYIDPNTNPKNVIIHVPVVTAVAGVTPPTIRTRLSRIARIIRDVKAQWIGVFGIIITVLIAILQAIF